MKNEAGLPPMKRAFGTRRGKCALRFTRAKIAQQFVSASWQQSCRFIFAEQMLHFKRKWFLHTVASNRLHTMLRIDLRLVMMSRTSAVRPSEPHSRHSLLGTLANYVSLLCRTPFVKTRIFQLFWPISTNIACQYTWQNYCYMIYYNIEK